jgi:hypothetical protein
MFGISMIGQDAHIHQAVFAKNFTMVNVYLTRIFIRFFTELTVALLAFCFQLYPPAVC